MAWLSHVENPGAALFSPVTGARWKRPRRPRVGPRPALLVPLLPRRDATTRPPWPTHSRPTAAPSLGSSPRKMMTVPSAPLANEQQRGEAHAHEYMNQRREEPDVVSIPGRWNWDHSKRRSYIRPKQGEASGCHCCMLPPDKATANSCLGYLWS